MGVVRRGDSPYWWVNLERPGLPPLRESTKIPIAGASPHQTKANKTLAEQVYAIRMGDLAQGRHGLAPKPQIAFVEYARWYLATVTPQKRTGEREASAIRTLIRFFDGRALAGVDQHAVQEYMRDRARHVKASTVNREIDVLKHMLRTAVPRYLEASPLLQLKRLRTTGVAVRAIERDEEARLIKHATPEMAAFIVLGITSMMRLGDLVHLKWPQIKRTHVDVIDPKTGRPYKAILTARAARALKPLKRTTTYVFPMFHGGRGERPSENAAIRAFAAVCLAAGVPHGRAAGGITIHCMRHTGATRALAGGASVRAVQELGGWSDVRMVMRYVHPKDRELIAAAARI